MLIINDEPVCTVVVLSPWLPSLTYKYCMAEYFGIELKLVVSFSTADVSMYLEFH